MVKYQHLFSNCRKFFIATLNVTDALIRSSLSKLKKMRIFSSDLQGKHAPHNKLPQESEDLIQNFISSFPAVESHYCCKSTAKKYLDATLNTSVLYRIFQEHCNKKGLKHVSFEKFRTVFREFNLGFFCPKKDQCKICVTYNVTPAEKADKEMSSISTSKEKKVPASVKM